MDNFPLHKIAISGPTLASMIQRFSTSYGAVDGLLFGDVTQITPATLSDESSTSTDSDSSTLVATITGFFCSGTINSFYDATGRIELQSLRRVLGDEVLTRNSSLIGWFSGRRKTHLRPSMREFAVTASLSSETQLSFPIKNAVNPTKLTPCVFLVFASPPVDQTIHTNEYRAYQFRTATWSFEPKSMDIVNLGPAFRGHYGSFSPNSPFPSLTCELRGSPMNEDKEEESLKLTKKVAKDQRELDMSAEGFDVSRLSRLMGSEATNYTNGLEDLYEKMLLKIENLARQVEKSSSKVLEQENHNRKLKYKNSRSAVQQ
ncbi:BRCA1-A complex subunit Abraxas like [Quillaja saponaria]|uniref:BRCA1-A complex subunit Abraxas like n=1 Tax=Quillaja saponaria TaxID=32244 RepID=A0AAD7LN68_QUISA|nr:BRCA1-A complex subunit Abraxas like [Quillaja saponaria]